MNYQLLSRLNYLSLFIGDKMRLYIRTLTTEKTGFAVPPFLETKKRE